MARNCNLGGFENQLFEKIKRCEKLDFNELQCIERLLYMSSTWNHLLNIQCEVVDNDLELEFVVEKKSTKTNNRIRVTDTN